MNGGFEEGGEGAEMFKTMGTGGGPFLRLVCGIKPLNLPSCLHASLQRHGLNEVGISL